MKYTRVWYFGKTERKDNSKNDRDFVKAYIAENGDRIDVLYENRSSFAKTVGGLYAVNGHRFRTLAEAKAYIERPKCEVPTSFSMEGVKAILQNSVDYMKEEMEHKKEWGYSSLDYAQQQFRFFNDYADRLIAPYGYKFVVKDWKVEVVEK